MQLEKFVKHKMESCKLRDILLEFAKEIEALKKPVAVVTENRSAFEPVSLKIEKLTYPPKKKEGK